MSLSLRHFIKSSAFLLAAKILTVLCGLIQIPISLNYLGPELFGIWATLSSLITLLYFADLGLGNALQNKITHYKGTKNIAGTERAIGTSFICLSIFGVLLSLIFIPLSQIIPWSSLFHLNELKSQNSVGTLVLIFIGFSFIGLPVSLTPKIALGRQLNSSLALTQSAGAISSLAAIYFATTHQYTAPTFFFLSLLPQFLSNIALGIYLHWQAPHNYRFSTTEAKSLIKSSIAFIPPQLGAAIIVTAPVFILATLAGATSAASYSVCQRLFTPLNLIMSTLLTPLWASYAHAMSKNDLRWIKNAFLWSLIFATATAGAYSIFMIIFATSLLTLWVGSTLTISFSLVFLFAIWTFVTSIGQTIATLLNGLSRLRSQCVYGTTGALFSLFLMFSLGKQHSSVGILLALIIPYILITLPATMVDALHFVSKTTLASQSKTELDLEVILK